MAEPSAPSPSPPAQAGDEQPSAVDLRIISPSQGVQSPLVYTDLPIGTTVSQVKEKIRGSLTAANRNEVQLRLIHRGRVLDRDQATLSDVFGTAAIAESKAQTLHLVLRETPSQAAPPTVPLAPNAASSQAPPAQPQQPAPQPHPAHTHAFPAGGQGVHIRFGVAGHTPPAAQQSPFAMPQQPGQAQHQLPPQLLAQQQQLLAQQQQLLQNSLGWMNQFARPANLGQLLNQNQRERAAMGFNGINDAARTGQPGATEATGQNNPGAQPPNQTIVREGVMPNGSWRVTVNETVIPQITSQGATANQARRSPAPQPGMQAPPPAQRGPLSAGDVQNILRGAEANQATQIMTNAMNRSASGASTPNIIHAAPQVGVTMPIGLRPMNRFGVGSRTGTPDLLMTPAQAMANALSRAQPTSGRPDVYILSSPSGPRALLINNNAEAFYTPSARTPIAQPLHAHIATLPPVTVQTQHALQRQGTPHPANDVLEQWRQNAEQQLLAQQQQVQRDTQNVQQQQQQQAQQQAAGPPLGPPMRMNHPAGAIAALWPHIWLLIRMVVLIWCFTSPNWSWTRWTVVVGLATLVFVFNTGLLDGLQALVPLRRHIEGLLPMLDNHGRPREHHPRAAAAAAGAAAPPGQDGNAPPAAGGGGDGAARGGGGGGGGGGRGHPVDPQRVAQRLLEQHRAQNANWLMDQVRRMERAGLLFLASIAPGVAERHIANLEAEERAERARREAAVVAAAAEAAAAAAAEAALTAADASESLEVGGEDGGNAAADGQRDVSVSAAGGGGGGDVGQEGAEGQGRAGPATAAGGDGGGEGALVDV